MNTALPEKICARCGRRFTWRKKWERDWAQVRYCSAACRRQKIGSCDRALESKILHALARAPRSGLALGTLTDEPTQSEPLRQAARRLALDDRIQIIQSGQVIDPSTLAGPVVVRLSR